MSIETNYNQNNKKIEEQLARQARNYISDTVYNIFKQTQEAPEVGDLYTYLHTAYTQLRYSVIDSDHSPEYNNRQLNNLLGYSTVIPHQTLGPASNSIFYRRPIERILRTLSKH